MSLNWVTVTTPRNTVKGTEDSASKVPTRPGRNGGTLLTGNPGNKGGGRVKEYVEERATEILTDKTVWDVQLARARSGDSASLDRALHTVLGKPKELKEISGELTVIVKYDE